MHLLLMVHFFVISIVILTQKINIIVLMNVIVSFTVQRYY